MSTGTEYLWAQFAKDVFARETGIEIVEIGLGRATARMRVEERHCNSVGITHGGAIFTLADFAFAMAGNSYGQVALALNANITFSKATGPGTLLTAFAKEIARSRRTALLMIEVADDAGDVVAAMQGTVYLKKDRLPGAPEPD